MFKSYQVYFSNLLSLCVSSKEVDCSCLLISPCVSPCVGMMRPHIREGVRKYDIHSGLKSYKLKLLGMLVRRWCILMICW